MENQALQAMRGLTEAAQAAKHLYCTDEPDIIAIIRQLTDCAERIAPQCGEFEAVAMENFRKAAENQPIPYEEVAV